MKTPAEQKSSGAWKQFKGRLKEAWGDLTDDDLDRLEGKRDQLEGLLEQRTGQARSDIRKRLDELSRESHYGW
jgi:uncharacterized protein YjbJ (UPF0337 family)